MQAELAAGVLGQRAGRPARPAAGARARSRRAATPSAHPRPDILGAVLLAGSVGLAGPRDGEGAGLGLALGLRSSAWSLDRAARPRRRRRCTRRGTPHRSSSSRCCKLRSFSGAFAASVLYYAGFGAFVLNAVEFLTGEWHYSAIRAGLAIAPGPLCVLPFARFVAPRLAVRLGGPGRVAVLGALVNAGSQLFWLHGVQAGPAYVTHLLPAQLLGGMGVGLTHPVTARRRRIHSCHRHGSAPAAASSTWAARSGSVLGCRRADRASSRRCTPATRSTTYRHGVELIIAFFLVAAAIAAAFLSRRSVRPAAPQPSPDPAGTSADRSLADAAR